jgi:hypothetical protein
VGYVYQEFPKVKYHPKLGDRTVQNPAEEKSLGKGWYKNRSDCEKASRPVAWLKSTLKPWWEEWSWSPVRSTFV